VVFSDYDPQSVRLALYNAAQNGFPNARGTIVDWRSPPSTRYPLILGCDLIYEQQNHEPILHVIDVMLAPGGVCWLADPGRHQADAFVRLARSRGYPLEQRVVPREPFPGRPDGTTSLWLVRRKSEE
jgi:predicted nicotinamide N-methyase